jgi:hypothetical protein
LPENAVDRRPGSGYGLAMVEQCRYRVCPHRNVAAAYERFFRPTGTEVVFFYLDYGMQRCLAFAGIACDHAAALALSTARMTARLLAQSPLLVPRAGVEPA